MALTPLLREGTARRPLLLYSEKEEKWTDFVQAFRRVPPVLLFSNIFTSSPLPKHVYLTSASTDEIGILTTERNFT